ncbi:sigma-70 family RNA polymerase sigma factor [Actinophytocola sp.]|uniref:RNA polymerase sigma factor n=1 Tax=Actinophytocola sp. TaxID=1872138 RepID=UPI002D7F7026|nr:sigma-70 family RNA polymerase sigma factor [Actinophytocola sp.]HET9142990.1 sigma-70 family RNA polymerase sigma factor [Actinophytocola sp.]
MSEAVDEATSGAPSDAELIKAVRTGDAAAYGVLYERHLAAARRAATALASTNAEREDLVAEAFTRVLRVLRAGHGPDEAFRAYLLVTMRNTMITDVRRGADVALCAEVPEAPPRDRNDDPILARLEANVAAEAFATLPERWRTVLWHTEIEGESPAEIAPLLGLAPNSVSALAYRAREGLRQAYLRQHLPAVTRPDCRAIAAQLSIWVRRGCPRHTMRRITKHLDRCRDCSRLASGLVQVNAELRSLLGPVILGTPLALAYISASTGGSVAAAVATVPWLAAVKSVVVGAAVVTATGTAAIAADPTVPAPPVPVPTAELFITPTSLADPAVQQPAPAPAITEPPVAPVPTVPTSAEPVTKTKKNDKEKPAKPAKDKPEKADKPDKAK